MKGVDDISSITFAGGGTPFHDSAVQGVKVAIVRRIVNDAEDLQALIEHS